MSKRNIGFDIHSMDLFDSFTISSFRNLVRVPGGWVYELFIEKNKGQFSSSTTFIPYNNEFINIGDN